LVRLAIAARYYLAMLVGSLLEMKGLLARNLLDCR
jgi:hypothetical protein